MAEQDEKIEYRILTLADPTDQKKNPDWTPHETLKDMDKALNMAAQLHQDRTYQKVKVEKTFMDPDKGRTVNVPLREFERKQKKPIGAAVFVVLAIIGGIASFAITYLIAR